jgi:hypothetical protein
LVALGGRAKKKAEYGCQTPGKNFDYTPGQGPSGGVPGTSCICFTNIISGQKAMPDGRPSSQHCLALITDIFLASIDIT